MLEIDIAGPLSSGASKGLLLPIGRPPSLGVPRALDIKLVIASAFRDETVNLYRPAWLVHPSKGEKYR